MYCGGDVISGVEGATQGRLLPRESSVAPGAFEEPSKRIEGGDDIFVKIAVSVIAIIAHLVRLGCQIFVKIAAAVIACLAAPLIWLRSPTLWTWLSKIEICEKKENCVQNTHQEDYKGVTNLITITRRIGEVIEKSGDTWIWEHTVRCKGDSEQFGVLYYNLYPVLMRHPSTGNVEVGLEQSSIKDGDPQGWTLVRLTYKIRAKDIEAFHKVTEDLWLWTIEFVDSYWLTVKPQGILKTKVEKNEWTWTLLPNAVST